MKLSNVIGCALSDKELAARAALAGRLTHAVASVSRTPQKAEIVFTAAVDEPLLLELVRRERECCSFFEFDWRAAGRTLHVAIPEPRFQPSLDAVVGAIAGDL